MNVYSRNDILKMNAHNDHDSIYHAEIQIVGMTCAGCVGTIENHLLSLPGVREVSINLMLQNLFLVFNSRQISLYQVCQEVNELGFRTEMVSCSVLNSLDGEATRIGMIQTEVNTQRQAKAISEIDDLMTGMGALSIQFKHSDIIEEQEKRDSMEGRGCSSIMLDPVGEEPCDDLSIKRTEAIQESLEEQETKMQGTHLLRLEMQPKKKNHNRITRCLESARKMFESVQVLRRPIDKELNGAIHAIHEIDGVINCTLSELLSSRLSECQTLSILYYPRLIGARHLFVIVQTLLPSFKLKPTGSDSTISLLEREHKNIWRKFLTCFVPAIVVAIMAMAPHENLPALLRLDFIPGVSICGFLMLLLTTPIHFWGGWPFHSRAWKAIRNGYFTMELLISLSTNVTYLYSCFSLVYKHALARWSQLEPGQGLLVLEDNLVSSNSSVSNEFDIPHFFETPAIVIVAVLLGKTIETKVRVLSAKAMRRGSDIENATCVLLDGQDSYDKVSASLPSLSRASPFQRLPSLSTRQQFNKSFIPILNYSAEVDSEYEDECLIHQSLLQIDDIILVREREIIPTDGTLLSSSNETVYIDESIATGEAAPVMKVINDSVIGGSKTLDGSIRIRVTEVGKRTFLGRIQTLVDSANRQKSQTQLLADKLASRFIPFILVLTLLTLTVWVLLVMFDVVVPQPPVPTIRTMSSTAGLVRTLFILFSKATFITQFPIAVLAVACPCALGLATPTAVALATVCAARFGLFVKSVEVLELGAKQMTDIIFDKTGTLTTGNLRLSSVSVNHESAWPPDLQHAATEESTVLVSRLNALIRLSNVDLSLPEHDEGFNRPHCLLWLAGCLQSISDHPIAESVVRYCRQELRVGDLGTIEEMPQLVQPTEFRNIPGEGCIGQVDISPLLNLFGMPANEFEGRNRIRQIAIGNYRLCTRFLETWNCDSDQLNRLKSANINHQGQCYSGETYVYIVFERYYLGHLGFRDFPKQEARSVIAELKFSQRSKIWMCTGDCPSAAYSVGQQVGIEKPHIYCEMAPNEKAEMVQKLLSQSVPFESLPLSSHHLNGPQSKRVMMVGDGVNDAASLASATIGVVLGARARLSIAAAHVVLLSADLSDLLSFFDLSKITIRTIRLNFLWAFGFNILSLPIAAGLLYPRLVIPPAIAGSLMALSSLLVILNSLLVLRFKPRRDSKPTTSPVPLSSFHKTWPQFQTSLRSLKTSHTSRRQVELSHYTKIQH